MKTSLFNKHFNFQITIDTQIKMRGLLLCSIITASLLVGLLFVIGFITKPWDGNFVHEDMPKCYDSGLYNFLNTFWRPELDPGESKIYAPTPAKRSFHI
mmetsp:Transcript_7201/g.10941  ORF Transcript_7201/g.10941 Transcript_7201/m.10941 type:complete len:99 (+) Transcript_7201:109-405(+)